MIPFWRGFLGFLCGAPFWGCLGYFVAALCAMAGRASDYERQLAECRQCMERQVERRAAR